MVLGLATPTNSNNNERGTTSVKGHLSHSCEDAVPGRHAGLEHLVSIVQQWAVDEETVDHYRARAPHHLPTTPKGHGCRRRYTRDRIAEVRLYTVITEDQLSVWILQIPIRSAFTRKAVLSRILKRRKKPPRHVDQHSQPLFSTGEWPLQRSTPPIAPAHHRAAR